MNEELTRREQLSALADGELQGEEWLQAMAHAGDDSAQSTWATYHLVGDVLRSPELAQHGRNDLLASVRAQLAREASAPVLAPAIVTQVAVPEVDHAANASVFRWKMVAGFASLAAVSAIGWTSMSALRSGSEGAQLAAAPATAVAVGAPLVAVAAPEAQPVTKVVQQGQSMMLRDPRLDELLAAHRQYGGASALQMPAGFLRNATFEAPSR
jgi:sigma-E factor negative regulatory protein RseA